MKKIFSYLTVLSMVISTIGAFPLTASAHQNKFDWTPHSVFHNGHEHGDQGDDEKGDKDDNEDHDDHESKGSITVCKIIIKPDGTTVTDGSELSSPTSVTVPGGTVPNNSHGYALSVTTFTTPLSMTDGFLDSSGEENDAQCVTYSDLKIGSYYYGQETATDPSLWDSTMYNDQFSNTVNDVTDFYSYNTDGTQNGYNSDGVITLTKNKPNRTLIVLNKLKTPPTSTIVATKIVCDNESDLPNWGSGGPDITDTTASTFISTHPNCHLASDWQFQWVKDSDSNTNPGDNVLTPASSPWTTMPSTNGSGQTSVTVPAGSKIWVREVLKDGYVPFTFNTNNQTNVDNVSAEIYCNTDVLNYDNWDWIDPVIAGQTYQCVAFNALKQAPPTLDIQSCGVVQSPYPPSGEMLSPTTYDYSGPNDPGDSTSGNQVDHKWVHVHQTPVVWDMITPTDTAYLVPSIDHDPFPAESHEATLFGSDSPTGPWVAGIETTTFPLGPTSWISDNDTTSWKFGQAYRYISATAGGTLQNDGDAEIDAVCSPEVIPPPICDPGQELIQNGSFETPAVPLASWDIFPSGAISLDWVVSWFGGSTTFGSGTRPTVANLEIQTNGLNSSIASNGTQFAELDTDWDGPSGSLNGEPASVAISQNITTVPGTDYKLTYDFSPRPNTGSSENKLEVIWGGVLGDTVGPIVGGVSTIWSSHTLNFTATSTNTFITFRDAGTPEDSLGTLLDNVSLRCVPPENIPECDEGEHLNIDNECISDDVPPPTDVCPNIDGNQSTVPEGKHLNNDGQCVPNGDDNDDEDENTPTDVCPNIDGNQSEVPSGKHKNDDGQCVDNTTTESTNDENNGGGGGGGGGGNGPGGNNGPINFGFVNGGNGGGGGNGAPQGQVLGASCTPYLDSYIGFGKKNNPDQVRKLQEFLNEYLGLHIPVTGFFGPLTYNAVKQFQIQENIDIIGPWSKLGLLKDKEATGYVYKTTKRKINLIKCSELDIPIPQLP